MLNQLEPWEDECLSSSPSNTAPIVQNSEMHAVESSESLPDTLDIGDVSESVSSATCNPLKLKNMAGKTSASSSGATKSAAVS
ncbi:polyadenylate-binding protein-interacting protein 6-like [Hibiscus syriacus]|uniref:polyadenylate-binding protein-interacting protein 6-like n=1 Tax=Hibiscus syriacus TaxID=106335 RepID=UPI001920AC74|nr:polyadenylate-binding protein-interacting protein 6-like [Hibiscus syriacus]